MRILSIITLKNGRLSTLETYGIPDDETSDEVLDEARERFNEVLNQWSEGDITEENLSLAWEDGYWMVLDYTGKDHASECDILEINVRFTSLENVQI